MFALSGVSCLCELQSHWMIRQRNRVEINTWCWFRNVRSIFLVCSRKGKMIVEDWKSDTFSLSCSCSGSGQTGSGDRQWRHSAHHKQWPPPVCYTAQSLQPPATTRTGFQVHSVTSVTKPLPEEEKMVTSIHLLSNKCRLHNKDKMSLLLKSSFYLV